MGKWFVLIIGFIAGVTALQLDATIYDIFGSIIFFWTGCLFEYLNNEPN